MDQIAKLARKGLTPSQIGVTLRDSHGIPQVRFVTGNKILRILKSNGIPLTYMAGVVDVDGVFVTVGQVWRRRSRRTSGTSSRRLSPSASTSRPTARTRTPSSVSS